MSYAEQQQQPGRRGAGFAVVVLLHVAIVYALVNGLARKAVEIVKGPIETKLIEELKKLPPPDKPPPPPPKAQPKLEPPPFVPPSEVAVAAPTVAQAPTITTSTAAPPVAVPPPPPPAPPKPVERVAPVVDAAKNCPKPEYPAASKRLEEEGTVLLRFMIDEGGKVIESRVDKSSGYTRLDEAARVALSQCQFKPGTADGKPERSWASLKYTWRLE